MYHMLAGRPPYGGEDRREKLDRHRGENPRPLHEANSQVPQALSKVVQYMLVKTRRCATSRSTAWSKRSCRPLPPPTCKPQ